MSQDPYAAQLQEARDLIDRGEREQAVALLYGVVATAPNLVEAWWLIARATPHTFQRQEALKTVLQLDPSHEAAQNLARRMGQFDVPTVRRGDAQEAAPAPVYQQTPPPQSTPPVGPPPAPDYGPPLEAGYAAQPAPPSAPPLVVEREMVYVDRERVRRDLQPFLVFNGGCSSGCFSLLLTIIVVLVLGFLLVGDTIGGALRSAGVLDPGQAVPVDLVPAVAVTAGLSFLQANATGLPIDLASLFSQPDNAAVLQDALHSLWSSGGYPATTGDIVVAQLAGLGPQLSSAGWVVAVIFLGGWVGLAFLFVFLRARSNRMLHWFLSTVGLWLLAGGAIVLANLLFRLVFAAS